jgi:uncharacterized protein (TIGR00730 family)
MNEEANKPIVNLPHKQLPIEPITLYEVEDEIKKRVSLIDQEFTRGFDFIKNEPKTITFFGSSRFTEENEHYQRAKRVAYKLAKLGFSIVTGGGPGIMEAANRGAFEAEGRSLGLNIKLPNEQVRNPYITDTVDFYYFFTRKVMLTFSAEAYLVFPGGLGTFDEAFEILTLVQTHKIENVPVVLVGESFWKPMLEFMRKHMLEENHAIDEQDLSLFTITDDEDLIAQIVKDVPVRNGVRIHHKDGESGQ